MAYTEQRTDRQGRSVWIGRFRVDGRLRSTRTFTARREALAEARRQEDAGRTSQWVDPAGSRVTLTEWFETWQASRADRAPRTLEAERERFRSLVEPVFGATSLRRISHEDVARWASTMPAPTTGAVASPARRRDAVRLLVALLDAAVDARRLPANPARTPSGRVPSLPRATKTKAHRYLGHEQLRRVADAAGPAAGGAARTLILLTGLTGLRWGEVSALTVADVDPLRRRVHVTKAYTRLDDGTLLLGDTKTHARREVPLPTTLATALADLAAGRRPGDLLFPSATGTPLRRESFDRSAFRPAVAAAGSAVTTLQGLLGLPLVTGLYDDVTLAWVRRAQTANGLPGTGVCDPATWAVLVAADPVRDRLSQGEKVRRTRLLTQLGRTTLGPGAEDFADLTLHDLRHTAASLAIAGGATVKAVQRMLGHESPILTLATYAGLFEDDLDRLGDSMSAAFEASAAGTGPGTRAGVTSIGPARAWATG